MERRQIEKLVERRALLQAFQLSADLLDAFDRLLITARRRLAQLAELERQLSLSLRAARDGSERLAEALRKKRSDVVEARVGGERADRIVLGEVEDRSYEAVVGQQPVCGRKLVAIGEGPREVESGVSNAGADQPIFAEIVAIGGRLPVVRRRRALLAEQLRQPLIALLRRGSEVPRTT